MSKKNKNKYKKAVYVRPHKRKKPSGGRTFVRGHSRKIKGRKNGRVSGNSRNDKNVDVIGMQEVEPNSKIAKKINKQIPKTIEIKDNTESVVIVKDNGEVTKIKEFTTEDEVYSKTKNMYVVNHALEKAEKYVNRSKGHKRTVMDDYEYYILNCNRDKCRLFKFDFSWTASQRLFGLTNTDAVYYALNNNVSIEEANENVR